MGQVRILDLSPHENSPITIGVGQLNAFHLRFCEVCLFCYGVFKTGTPEIRSLKNCPFKVAVAEISRMTSRISEAG